MAQLFRGNSPTLQVGGRVFTDLDNLIILYGITLSAALLHTTFKRSFSSAWYTAPASGFRMLAIRVSTYSTNGPAFNVGYNDVAIGFGSAGAFTNFVSQFGDLSSTIAAYSAIGSAGAVSEFAIDGVVPSGKYPCLTTDGTVGQASYEIFGYVV